MNKKNSILLGLMLVPTGALFLNACGPQAEMGSDMALDAAASDNIIVPNYPLSFVNPDEYGRCRDAWDNDGDGLVDMADPDCHIDFGPLRDLSLYDAPIGHNFMPDVTTMLPGGPGMPGGFRDRAQITLWARFLTEPDGGTAGKHLFGPGVNPEVVPIPAPLSIKPYNGTYAQGNNNNVDIRDLNAQFLEPATIVPLPAGPADAEFLPTFNKTRGLPRSWPGLFYKGGSQGYLLGHGIGSRK